jgi:N utilization substance protein A
MHVDMKLLEALTTERGISLEQLISAIEIGVKTAYANLPTARMHAFARLDRATGEISIVVPTFGPDGERFTGRFQSDRDLDCETGDQIQAS